MKSYEITKIMNDARKIKGKAMEFTDKSLKRSISADALKYMSEEDIHTVKDFILLIDEFNTFSDEIIDAYGKLLVEQRETSRKIDEIYLMMKKAK